MFHLRDSREEVSAIYDYKPKIRTVACVRCGASYKKRKVTRDGVVIEHGYCANIECKRIAMPGKRVEEFLDIFC